VRGCMGDAALGICDVGRTCARLDAMLKARLDRECVLSFIHSDDLLEKEASTLGVREDLSRMVDACIWLGSGG